MSALQRRRVHKPQAGLREPTEASAPPAESRTGCQSPNIVLQPPGASREPSPYASAIASDHGRINAPTPPSAEKKKCPSPRPAASIRRPGASPEMDAGADLGRASSVEADAGSGREVSSSLPPVRTTIQQWSRDLRQAHRSMPKVSVGEAKPNMPILPPAGDCIRNFNRGYARGKTKNQRGSGPTRRPQPPSRPHQRSSRPAVPSRQLAARGGSRRGSEDFSADERPCVSPNAWASSVDGESASEISDSELSPRGKRNRRRSLSDSELEVAPVRQLGREIAYSQPASECTSVSSQSDNESLIDGPRGRLIGDDAGPDFIDEVEEDEVQDAGALARRESEADGFKLSPWDEWRIHFPLQALNILTKSFVEKEGHPSGVREMNLEDLRQLATTIKVPLDAIRCELLAKQQPHRREASVARLQADADDDLPATMYFASLPHLLDFFLAASLRSEIECGELLWRSEELTVIEEAYTKCADASGQLPSLRVFDVFRAVKFLKIDANKVEQQHKIVDAMRCVLGEKVSCANAVSRPGASRLSFEELVRIITRAECWWRRHLRRLDVRCERQVQEQADFTAGEVEDMRELFMTFTYLQTQVENVDNFLAMKALLEKCGVPRLREEELAQLTKIVHSPAMHSAASVSAKDVRSVRKTGLVPFSVFMEWMSKVFNQELGGLKSGGIPCSPKGQATFLSAFLRADREVRQKAMFSMEPESVCATPFSSDLWQSEQRGSVSSVVSSENPSKTESLTRAKLRMRTMPAGSGSGPNSRTRSRRESISSIKRSGSSSKLSSTKSSRQSSRRSSGALTRKEKKEKESEGATGADEQCHLVLKGLPTPQSMLGHKMMRACSVDLSGKDAEDGAQPQQQNAGDKLRAFLKMSSADVPQQEEKQGRKAKEAQDTGTVVMEAITRLQWHEVPDDG